jgi:hypothetical protein
MSRMQVAAGGHDERGLGMGSRTGTRRVGPVYDDAMRALADDDTAALLHLAGIPARESVRRHGDLPAHTIHADLVVALSSGGVVHMEYVKDATPDLDLRMVDYRIRLRRRDHTGSIRQFVLALGDSRCPTATQTWTRAGSPAAGPSSAPAISTRPTCSRPRPRHRWPRSAAAPPTSGQMR